MNDFAVGDRVCILKNDRGPGTVTRIGRTVYIVAPDSSPDYAYQYTSYEIVLLEEQQ